MPITIIYACSVNTPVSVSELSYCIIANNTLPRTQVWNEDVVRPFVVWNQTSHTATINLPALGHISCVKRVIYAASAAAAAAAALSRRQTTSDRAALGATNILQFVISLAVSDNCVTKGRRRHGWRWRGKGEAKGTDDRDGGSCL